MSSNPQHPIMKIPRGTVKYLLKNQPTNTHLSTPEIYIYIHEAFRYWAAVSNFDFIRTTGDDWTISLEFGELPATAIAENPNAIASTEMVKSMQTGMETGQRSIIFSDARTWVDLNSEFNENNVLGDKVLAAAITFFTNIPNLDLMTTAMHEIGHALGLPHNSDTTSVMQARIGWVTTMPMFIRGRQIAEVDAQALNDLYANFYPAPNPVPDGYAIVGSTFWMTPVKPDGSKRDIAPLCWGVREGTPKQAVMSGYGWNPNLNKRGYGYLNLHLMPAGSVEDREYVIGGGTIVPNSHVGHWDPLPNRETFAKLGVPNSSTIDKWGDQNGTIQLCARAERWNVGLGKDDDSFLYFVLTKESPKTPRPAQLVAYETSIGSAGLTNLYTARQWQPTPFNPAGLNRISLCECRTWPDGKSSEGTYDNANSRAYAYLK